MENNVPQRYDTNDSMSSMRYRTMQFLPSRKIVITIIVLICIGIGYIIYPHIPNIITKIRHIGTKPEVIENTLPRPKFSLGGTSSSIDKDTDMDGIPDWQETLFNLNPESSDTNADGTPDAIPADVKNVVENPNIINNIDKIALNIYTDLAKNGDQVPTKNQIENAVSTQVLAYANSVDSNLITYSSADITIVDVNPDTIARYQKDITVLLKTTTLSQEGIKQIYDHVVNSTGVLPVIYLKNINQTITSLLTTPVPLPLAEEHLKLINGLYHWVQIINGDFPDVDVYTKTIVLQKNFNAWTKSGQNIGNYFIGLN